MVCSILTAAVVMAAAQGPPPEVRKRIDAFVEALASGDPVGFTLPCTWQPCGGTEAG